MKDAHDGGPHSADDTLLALKWIGTTLGSDKSLSDFSTTLMSFISNYIVWNLKTVSCEF